MHVMIPIPIDSHDGKVNLMRRQTSESVRSTLGTISPFTKSVLASFHKSFAINVTGNLELGQSNDAPPIH